MAKTKLLKDKSYTFSDYFELNNPTKDIVAEFGYTFRLQRLNLSRAAFDGSLAQLKSNFYKKLPYISLNSEMAKREMMVAPLLLELLDYTEVNIDIEYPLNVNERLKGSLDYLLRSTANLVVIEAKNADMERGFSQLAVEMIALDQYFDDDDSIIYGAVTVGDLWRFGLLHRTEKLLAKDIDSFRIPADLEELFAVLIGILKPTPPTDAV